MRSFVKQIEMLTILGVGLLLSGCKIDVLQPAGYVARQQLILIAICVFVMLCVVIPVMVAVIVLAIKYRASNTKADYLPDWGHSNKVEAFMWGVPIAIIVILGALTAYYTYRLEPSNPLPVEVAGEEKPLQVNAVALDWKWLFIYPEYGIASINEIYAPKDRQVLLQLTSESSLNAFWVPKLGTVLYAMPQMNSKLHLVADEKGIFNGNSANYSGDGFSHMRFHWHSVSLEDFNDWVTKVRDNGQKLDRVSYRQLAIAPRMNDIAAKEKDAEVRYFAPVEKRLYYRIVNRCVDENTICNEDLMKRAAAQTLWGALCSVFDPDAI
ncbi:ubiquinol oxidase, subunit II [Bartonella bacilliformis str. Heidi Mejia]|uniref:ubiquinol oxidase subunit II n=1 Tax=Bartonella bacilliformis TaxID=774 RepID=UPI000451E01B|nr:ubiquinol oxidase subunit II [Bartonella bacilliformis]EYS90915.1 ubiquinol oxidase, subunit II [Bartonella bacilliformis str. Heidi Mejia]KEG15764.1 ubiquinol oxidase, subunit II [Bartonella bacilliformis Cond044]KEG17507.1 ubiquinol oxidase, subunit II [Bartonella bacilliformis Hosp800-02]KEG21892.1 ubiquinol oxidase, subunit II [Bartonella bacilliformis VAB9028]KEG23267.1 ubiquinol oxidase, subunit II [Bartonella bacilliformis CAR600-02]